MSYSSRKRGTDQGGWVRGDWPPSPAYNVEPVTNTSSSSCANNKWRTPRWVLGLTLAAVRRGFIFHTSRLVRLITCVQRSQIFVQNRVFCLPHLHSTPPLWEFPSEYRHPVWHGNTRMARLPDGEKISKISLFVLTQLTNVTDTHTDTHRMTA